MHSARVAVQGEPPSESAFREVGLVEGRFGGDGGDVRREPGVEGQSFESAERQIGGLDLLALVEQGERDRESA